MPRLLLDCTDTLRHRHNSGIQRVVRQVLLHAADCGRELGLDVAPLVIAPGGHATIPFDQAQLDYAGQFGPTRWQGFLNMVSGGKWGQLGPPPIDATPTALTDEDVVVSLDAVWNLDTKALIDGVRRTGARLGVMVHDLHPLLHPEMLDESAISTFRRYVEAVGTGCDFLLTNSEVTRTDVLTWMTTHERPGGAAWLRPSLIRATPLGADPLPQPDPSAVDPAVRAAFDRAEGLTFLMVGSFRPYKNQLFVAKAFERLFAADPTLRLVLMGRVPHYYKHLLEEIQSSPAHGRQLLVFHDVTDDDLGYAYHHAAALIQASRLEGFGLPIAEAMAAGCPIICSEIPIFREVARDDARYFRLEDAASLTAVIEELLAARRPPLRADASLIRSWKDVTRDILKTSVALAKLAGEPAATGG